MKMVQTNLLRMAVENRKKSLIRLLESHRVVGKSEQLNQWTLSELEQEWKRYLKWGQKDIG
jgi:hypothetical protein